MKRLISIFFMVVIAISLTACKQSPSVEASPTPSMPIPPDLSGQWEQVGSEFEGRHLSGVISEDTIELYWINDEDDTRILYWAGTFTAPEESTEEPYSWISRNNTKKTELSLVASRDKTKEFIYDDGTISCSTTSGGYTCIVNFEKERWAPDLDPGEFYNVEHFAFPIAGVNFSIPSYFEKDMDASANDGSIFHLNWEGFENSGRLIFLEVPVSQQEYENEKDEFIKAFCGETAHILVSTEILIANLPAQFFVCSTINQYDVTVHMYGALTYNVAEEKALLIILATTRTEDYSTYFQQLTNTAKLVGTSEISVESPAFSTSSLTGIRPEFKEAMDSYEAFYDEYCSFMKQYYENPTDLTLLTKYADMTSRLADIDEKFEAWESEDMSTEELKYYLDVNSRITSKLLDIVS